MNGTSDIETGHRRRFHLISGAVVCTVLYVVILLLIKMVIK